MDRRLTAILAADVVGYTRLMGDDETRALAALTEVRSGIFEPGVAARSGEILKRMGDGWLVAFPNVAQAVACAVEVQERLEGHALIRLRIGVHIGDVTFGADDLYGDGINVAARLEALAEPGQVMISDSVHHSLDQQGKARFLGGDTRTLKNVSRPVQVWHWPAGGGATAEVPARSGAGRPSIAVLPFANMSGDHEQEYFADGMAEDIITELSRFRSMLVIARNSSFAYKGQSPDLREVSRDLGVKYILEGSIRKSGARVRVTAQLIEGVTGAHIWAERYDRSLDDIFALQDEITGAIVNAIGPEIDQVEREQASRLPLDSLDAWASYQRGLWHMYRFNKDDNAEAERLFRAAIAEAPRFGRGHSGLAHALYYAFVHDYSADQAGLVTEAYDEAQQAAAIDPRDAEAHFALGRMYYVKRDFRSSITAFERAIELNPSFSHAHLGLGTVLAYDCDFEAAIAACEQAIRLSPHDPARWVMFLMVAVSHFGCGRVEAAETAINEAVRDPGAAVTAHMMRAGILARLGHPDTQEAAERVRRMKPDLDADYIQRVLPFSNEETRAQFLAGVREAGLEI